MSIEAEPRTSPDGQLPVQALPAESPAAPSAKPKTWQRRRYQAIAIGVALILGGGALGNNLIARQYTPEGAVRQYLGALQAGDSATAWSVVQIAAARQAVTASLTDQTALKAALTAAKPDLTNFSIASTLNQVKGEAIVTVDYDTSKGGSQAIFGVQRSGQTRFFLYPVWRVVLSPTLLNVSLPAGANGIKVDGKPVDLPAGKSTIAVLPIAHKLQFNGTQMLTSQLLDVNALFSPGQSVAYQPKLTPAGVETAKSAVQAAFTRCAQETNPHASAFSSCPQSVDTSVLDSGQWQLLGDPTADLTVRSDEEQNLVGIGHYQMLFAYNVSYIQGTAHLIVAGPFSAPLTLLADNITVSSISRGDQVPALHRSPAATDQAAIALVTAALPKCAAVRAGSVADCPQWLADGGGTNVRWTLSGDPQAGATVSFDQNSGVYTVHGHYKMSATYNWFGVAKKSNSFSDAYNAYLLWDGQALRLITIAGA